MVEAERSGTGAPRRQPREKRDSQGGASETWLALLAATSVGLDLCTVRTQIVAPAADRGAFTYRLVVQSYDLEALCANGLPKPGARPRGSVQRSVSGEELGRGVGVSLVELGSHPVPAAAVAWIEESDAELEYGGYEARPRSGLARATGEIKGGESMRTHLELRTA